MISTMAQAPHPEPESALTAATCVRCRTHKAPEVLALCPSCATETWIESAAGIRRLGEYLAAWAAFDAWSRSRGDGPVSA